MHISRNHQENISRDLIVLDRKLLKSLLPSSERSTPEDTALNCVKNIYDGIKKNSEFLSN